MKTIITLILSVSILISCCSKLKVVVKVADRDKIADNHKDYGKEQVLASIISLQSYIDHWDKESLLKTILDFVATLGNKNGEKDNIDEVKESYRKKFSERYDPQITQITEYLSHANALYINKKYQEASVYSEIAYLQIVSIKNELKTYNVAGTNIDISDQVPDINKLQKPRSRFPILGDPIASYIAKENNDDIWKSIFNKTVSSSFLGNSDVAYILRSNPPEEEVKSGDYNNNFTIKGVRMDAADVTNAVFTTLTQTINFVAASQGVPLRSQPNTENPQPVQSPEILNLTNDQKKLEIKSKKYKDYTHLLLEKINMENIQNKDGENLNEAIKRIQEYWEFIKKDLT